jgi:hypothetical protein
VIDISSVIHKLYPSVVRTVGSDNPVAYDKEGNQVDYDLTQINNYLQSVAYVAKRQAEYPAIAEQLDKIFHEGIDSWKVEIQAIKDKYPKGTA